MKWWTNLSVSKKLYCVVGTMGILIAMELFTLIFAMNTLSAVRAFVAGEGYWSKAQKDSISYLQKYAITQDEKFYHLFTERIKVPLGDHAARIELEKPVMDYAYTTKALIAGNNHPDDIPEMIKLMRRFGNTSYLGNAIKHWREADVLLDELIVISKRMHADIRAKDHYSQVEINQVLEEISILNDKLTVAEDGFSNMIGVASRFLESFLMITLILAVITIEGTGLLLTISFSRNLTKALGELNDAAKEVEQGNFDQEVPVRSKDELGQLALSINAMTESLQRQVTAVNIRDNFLSMASHELKTPLTTLKLQAELRMRSLDRQDYSRFEPEKLRRIFEDEEYQLNRLIRLVDDMLDISRIRSGKFTLQRTESDLVSVVKAVFRRLEPQTKELRTTLHLEAPEILVGRFDSFRLEQVVINLITNAMKYGNQTPVKVRLSQNANEASIVVTDQGRGISDQDKERIFEQFERAISPMEVSGLGLGLYIAKQIVDAHNGSIKVESELGKGSTFIVTLPV